MTSPAAARVGLGYLIANALLLGPWATLFPRSFYDHFPGLGRTWVSVDGPYNEHLLRDVGALNLALAVVLIAAFVSLSKQLVSVAAWAALAWGVPHFAYHAAHTDHLSTSDNVLSLGGLTLGTLIPVGLLVWASRLGEVDGEVPLSAPD